MKFHAPGSLFFITLCLCCAGTESVWAQRDKRKKDDASLMQEMKLREAEFFFTEAEKYFILEDYTKALVVLQRVVELNPEEPSVHYKIAEVLSRGTKQDDYERAAISIETALRLEKKNKYYYTLASSIYSSLNNFQRAEEVLETMMKEVKGTDEYLYELAAIYQFDHKPDEAIKTYNKAEDLFGINEVSSLQKQKIYLEQGKINDAIAEGEKLLAANPDEERYVVGFAEALSQKGQQARATQELENYITRHPEAGPARILLAAIYRDNGDESKARKLLLDAFNNPLVDVSSKVIVIGTYRNQLAQQRSRKMQDAETEKFTLELFRLLHEQHGEDPNVHLIGGDLFMTLRIPDQAEHEYLEAIQHGSSSFEAWQNLLSLEAQNNRFDSLIFHSEQGLEIFPNQALLHYFNGYGNYRKGHLRQAAGALEQGRKLSGNNLALHKEISSLLGDVYNALKDYARSDQAYEEVLLADPDNTMVLNNYSYYLALRKENLEKAEKMAERAVKLEPTNSSFLDTYAWVLYARERYRDARKVMEKALALPDASATHFEHYGDILFRLGDVDGAVHQWEKARSMTTQHDLIDKKIANRRIY